ncbi:MAG: hypothetical protein OEV21_07385 [Thermoplasmata archaeon]|nr:hypothetical protein [Thermoplasmata archaeon]
MNGWQELYEEIVVANPLRGCRVITAYNEVIDLVHKLRNDDIQRLRLRKTTRLSKSLPRNLEDFAAALDFSLRNGVARELHVDNRLFKCLESDYDFIHRIGGQAAIIGIVISRFSGHPAIIHPDRIDNLLSALLENENLLLPIFSRKKVRLIAPSQIASRTRSERHLIFEFAKGQNTIAGGVCPRHNRLIIDPISAIKIDSSFEKILPTIAQTCDVFVVSGLDHMGKDYESVFKRVASHVQVVKESNPRTIVHLEITSMTDKKKMYAIATKILPLFDSVGFNEAELVSLSSVMKNNPQHIDRDFTLDDQFEAIEVLLKVGIKRIHLHTLGYHLRAGRTTNIESSVRALAFSAAVGCAAAVRGMIPFPEDLRKLSLTPSQKGLRAVKALTDRLLHRSDALEFPRNPGNGFICVPAPIIKEPQLTVGLGDCISGTCVAAEKMSGAI